jgi:surface carbohydrate biosynthesis protein
MLSTKYNSNRKWLIIGIEIAHRELLGKLLICLEAKKRGWGCIIATRAAICANFDKLPKGIFLIKSSLLIDEPYIFEAIKHGQKVYCLDEEGLIRRKSDDFAGRRITLDNMKRLSGYFVWGRDLHHTVSQRYQQYKEKILITGNPRTDIWTGNYNYIFKSQIQNINAKYDKCILIITTCGRYNHYLGKGKGIELPAALNKLNKSDINLLNESETYTKQIFKEFLDLIPALSEYFVDYSIIIRVHPAENEDPWNEQSNRYKNVHVVNEGSITPWILSSDIVIQHNSTTSIEAFLQNKPVISFSKTTEEQKDSFQLDLPSTVSVDCKSVKDVIETIDRFTSKEEYIPDKKVFARLTKHMANIDNFNSSCELILDIFDKEEIPDQKFSIGSTKNTILTKYYRIIINILSNTILHCDKAQLLPTSLRNKMQINKIAYGTLHDIYLRLLIKIYYSRLNFFMPLYFKNIVLQYLHRIGYGQRKKRGYDLESIKSILSLISKDNSISVAEYTDDVFVIE